MPELPEVEVVRRGLDTLAVGSVIDGVEVRHARSVRRHLVGPADFVGRVTGCRVVATGRRGKFLWLVLDSSEVMFAHLGMSGQFHVRTDPEHGSDHPHLRVRFALRAAESDPVENGAGYRLDFVDQRMFGGLWLGDDPTDGGTGELAHVAPDPLEPGFDDAVFAAALRSRRTGVKRALLDQKLISGIGNIYADEALWRARMHYARPTATMRRPEIARLLAAVREVLADALAAGGTSFDALYVDVNGDPGYFGRELAVYGAEGEPCPRCGAAIRREAFMNRSSYRCPRCQPRPRKPHW